MNKFKNIMLTAVLGSALIAGGGTALARSNKKDNKSKARSEAYCPQACNQACAPVCAPGPCAPDSCAPGRPGKPGPGFAKRGGRPGNPMARALEGLDLTQAQKDSVKSIAKRQRQSVKEGERKLREQVRANTDKELQQVLTPEQFAKYQANREQQKELRKNAPKGPRGDKQFGHKKGHRHGHHADKPRKGGDSNRHAKK